MILRLGQAIGPLLLGGVLVLGGVGALFFAAAGVAFLAAGGAVLVFGETAV